MTVGFSGEVAEYYARFRRGYPERVFDVLQEYFALSGDDRVLDLGCGTGQLAVPLAARVRSVIGMDPEPDMLRLAREAAAARGADNVTWVLGADTDVPALGAVWGDEAPLAMTVVGQALHWMRHEALFRTLSPLCRVGGGVAVVANGAPLWLQDTAWSRALRAFLERYFDTELTDSCGTAGADRLRYARALQDAGFREVRSTVVSSTHVLSVERIVGEIYSALPAERLPSPAERPAFAQRVREALPADDAHVEEVHVSVLVGRAR